MAMSAKSKKVRLGLRVTDAVKSQIEMAADLQGRSVSDFVLGAAIAQACAVIEQHKYIKLGNEDSLALADTFINKQKPNKKAIKAALRHRDILK
jgi:uncharacterized protein (DUF1778 family)